MPTLTDIAPKLAGKFLVFEGADGSGKTTQLKQIVTALTQAGLTVTEVREPGGTPIGEEIRRILLHTKDEMTLTCEMLLYMASRAQLVEQLIRPALAAGHLVIADRFVSSTLAYQGAGGGLSCPDILAVANVATLRRSPDLIIIFDVDRETAARRTRGLERPGGRSRKPQAATGTTLFDDRIESRGADFHDRVRQSYLDQAKADPAHHLVVDARGTPEAVWGNLLRGLCERAW